MILAMLRPRPDPATGASTPSAAHADRARDTGAGSPCHVVIDTVGHSGRQVEVRKGRPTCSRAAAFARTARVRPARSPRTASPGLRAWGASTCWVNVEIRDTAFSIDAMTASYFVRQERLEAHKDVVADMRFPAAPCSAGPT